MLSIEYLTSLLVALLILAGTVAWTQASARGSEAALSCPPGRELAPVSLKGMTIYPGCSAKRG